MHIRDHFDLAHENFKSVFGRVEAHAYERFATFAFAASRNGLTVLNAEPALEFFVTGNRKCVHTVGAAFRKVLDVGMFNPVKLADADGKKVDVKQDQKFLIFGFFGNVGGLQQSRHSEKSHKDVHESGKVCERALDFGKRHTFSGEEQNELLGC